MQWLNYGLYLMPDTYPHETPHFDRIKWGGGTALLARWTEDFDCDEETQFWWIIMDRPFDISELKAKRRYEINKGNKNFYVKVIRPSEFKDELYDVHMESLKGYEHPQFVSREIFYKKIEIWENCSNCIFFGVFSKTGDRLCGYSDVYDNGKYIPISSLKTRVSCERDNVNFALVNGIVDHFAEKVKNGSYLCDGSRNVLHDTNFQNFLIKYFGFRKAYCNLKIRYRGVMKILFPLLFLFRNKIKKIPRLKSLYAVLRLHAWSKGIEG